MNSFKTAWQWNQLFTTETRKMALIYRLGFQIQQLWYGFLENTWKHRFNTCVLFFCYTVECYVYALIKCGKISQLTSSDVIVVSVYCKICCHYKTIIFSVIQQKNPNQLTVTYTTLFQLLYIRKNSATLTGEWTIISARTCNSLILFCLSHTSLVSLHF